MSALFNEIEPYAVKWLGNLEQAGRIAAGVVEPRSIKELKLEDVIGFTQAHFFAGIGVWSHALREAGWPDDEEVWTGSCPCQPYSAAGKKLGAADPRNLWPDWFRLIRQRRPARILGEQVASPDGLAWLDTVQSDLEGAGYACAAFDLCAAGFGAPHIRQRLYFAAYRLADSSGDERGQVGALTGGRGSRSGAEGLEQRSLRGGALDGLAHSNGAQHHGGQRDGDAARLGGSSDRGAPRRLAHHHHQQGQCELWSVVPKDSNTQSRADADGRSAPNRLAGSEWMGDADGEHPRWDAGAGDRAEGGAELRRSGDEPRASGAAGRLGFAGFAGFAGLEGHAGDENASSESRRLREDSARSAAAPGPTNGFWRDVEWLACRDQKWRPTQPGLLPLVDGVAGGVAVVRPGSISAGEPETHWYSRTGSLKALGNAIAAPQAVEFIRAVMDVFGVVPKAEAA